jgi:hypothetical protein
MSSWLSDFRDEYARHPLCAVGVLAAVILAMTLVSTAFAVRFDSPPIGSYGPPSTAVIQPAKGQAPGRSPARPGPAPTNCASIMPSGAGYDDSTNSWYAKHCLTNSPISRTTDANPSPSPRPARTSTRTPRATPSAAQPTSPPIATPPATPTPTSPPTTPAASPTTPTNPPTTPDSTSPTTPTPETS